MEHGNGYVGFLSDSHSDSAEVGVVLGEIPVFVCNLYGTIQYFLDADWWRALPSHLLRRPVL